MNKDKETKQDKGTPEEGLISGPLKTAFGGIKTGATWVKDKWVEKVWDPYLDQPLQDYIAKPWSEKIGTPFVEKVWTPFKNGVGPAWRTTKKGLADFGSKIRRHESISWKANFMFGVSVFASAVAVGWGLYTSYMVAVAIANNYLFGVFTYGCGVIGGVGLCGLIARASYMSSEDRYLEYYNTIEKDREALDKKAKKLEKGKGKSKEVESEGLGNDLMEQLMQQAIKDRPISNEDIAQKFPSAVAPGMRRRVVNEEEAAEVGGRGRGANKSDDRGGRKPTKKSENIDGGAGSDSD